MKYEGYENYETWCVSLWVSNDHQTYIFWRDAADWQLSVASEELKASLDHPSTRRAAVIALAIEMNEFVRAGSVPCELSLASDLLSMALDRVNWVEIAEEFFPDLVHT